MRMRLRGYCVGILGVFSLLPIVVQAEDEKPPEADPVVMRLVQRAVAWYPNSSFELLENTRHQTASGSFRVVGIKRTCESKILTGASMVLVDEVTSTAWLGSVANLPMQGATLELAALKSFVEGFLPDALEQSMRIKARVQWSFSPQRPGALIPFDLMVETGYGEYRRPAALTADGAYLVMGTSMPLKEDPVSYRRKLLAESELIVWDTPSGAETSLEIVEFSDFECPACSGKWPLIKKTIHEHEGSIRHGMVSFPLTMIHPWAFRAASATWCVSQLDPQKLISLKELFYSMQREMEVSMVTPTSMDFVAGSGLDEEAFKACYLRKQSLDGVLRGMSLGQQLGVSSTPTYYVDGWLIQVPTPGWFPDFVDRLLKGEEP